MLDNDPEAEIGFDIELPSSTIINQYVKHFIYVNEYLKNYCTMEVNISVWLFLSKCCQKLHLLERGVKSDLCEIEDKKILLLEVL